MPRANIVVSALLVIGLIALMPVGATAQGVGAIMLHSDSSGTSCNITGNPMGLVWVYVFHSFHNGVTASRFMIQDNGTGLVWILDELQHGGTLAIDNTNIGGSFAYGECVTTDFNFVNVLYTGQGTADICSSLEVVPDPKGPWGTIDAVTCSPKELFTADSSTLTVNCPNEDRCEGVLPVESTTWGQIKALYE